jgi:hypothetical protein
MQSCLVKAGMCWHEKVMLGVVLGLAAGAGFYFFSA